MTKSRDSIWGKTMQKAARHLSALLGRVLFIGLSVQGILGLLWMFCNFTSFQEYGDSFFLEKVSESLICDDYTGILYPLLIRVARGIASAVPVPYYCLLYLLQLAVGYVAALYFFRSLLALHGVGSGAALSSGTRDHLRIHWGALILVTFPMAMQCHLAVLPCSLTESLLLLQLGVFLRGTGERGEGSDGAAKIPARRSALLGMLWLLETLLMPEYLWIGLIPVLMYGISEFLRSGGEDLSKRLGIVLVVAAFLGVTPLALEMTVQPGVYGRMENTFEGTLMRRICGGYLQEYYGKWPQELKDHISQEDIVECTSGSEGIDRVLGREIESVYDTLTVKRLYREMVQLGWSYDRSNILSDVILDVLGYGFSPVLSRVYLRMAYYDSYARGNYDVMRRQTPRLTYYAMSYEGYWFVAGLGLTAVWLLVSRIAYPQKGKRKKGILTGFVIVGTGLWICLWYTAQGQGRMDHKYSMAVTVLWFAWMCCGAVKEIGRVE